MESERSSRHDLPEGLGAETVLAERVSSWREGAKVVWALAWPAVALNSLQVVNALLDTKFVGSLQAAALTAVGASTTVVFLLFSMAMALGAAPTALVSRAFGAGKAEEMRRATRQSLGVALVAGIGFAFLGSVGAWVAAQLLIPATDSEARRLMVLYLHAWSIGLPAIFVIQTLAASLRGIGDTKSPMVISGVQILLHILLNFVLIFPPRPTGLGIMIPGAGLGLLGAGAALAISAWVSALIYLSWTTKTPLGNCWRLSVPSIEWTKRILRIALPAAVQSVVRVSSLGAFTMVLAGTTNASVAIAALRAGFSIEAIMFMPSFGLAVAASALVGQSLGMKDPQRAERLGWTASHIGGILTLALSVPIFVLAPAIAQGLVEQKPLISAEAAALIRWLCVTEVFFAYAMVLIGAIQGAGDTVRPLYLTIVCMWLLRVPMAWLLAYPVGLGSHGAWIAMSFTQGVQGVLAIALFKRGKWKHHEV